MRVPQKGGAGTGLSAATSERAGIASGSVSVSFAPGAVDALLQRRQPDLSGAAPRAIFTSGSMRVSPSKASRA